MPARPSRTRCPQAPTAPKAASAHIAAPAYVAPSHVAASAPAPIAAPVAKLNGARLVEGELAQLQLALPGALPEWLKRLYLELPLAGAGVEVPEGLSAAREPRPRLVFFSVERMIEELLFHAPGQETIEHRRLPLAGCGRRTLLTYYVQLDGPEAGQLCVSGAGNERQLRPLTIGLTELLERAVPVCGLRVRRRLGLPAAGRKPRRASSAAACRRTLDLFESCA